MKSTGERLVTEKHTVTAIEHLHRYAIALEYTKNKTVLDIASGEGYGTNLIAGNASKIIGVDISEEAILHSKNKYLKSNIDFLVGSTDKIPCEDSYFDVVISFETIEHHDKHNEMFTEIKRVLKRDGILIISSPDKLNYSDRPKYSNPYHIKELYESEFKELINKNFKYSTFLKQRLDYLSIILPENETTNFECYTGSFDAIRKMEEYGPHYIISIASDNDFQKKNFAPFFYAYDIMQKKINNLLNIKKSKSYKIGNFILKPFSFLKGTLKRK